jgi:hypothetical protein
MLTFASLILPKKDNDGNDLFALHAALKVELIGAFGGYSASDISGAWQDAETGLTYQDDSTEYKILADWLEPLSDYRGGTFSDRLERIAGRYALAAGQECVLIVTANKGAQFIAPTQAPAQSVRETWEQRKAA